MLGGALLAFSRLGWSPLYRETTLEAPAQTADTQPETAAARTRDSLQQPAEAASDPAADENRYTQRGGPEARPDAKKRPQQPESAACTSLTLSAPTVTFEDAGRFFNITFTRKPAECTEPVTFTSSDENGRHGLRAGQDRRRQRRLCRHHRRRAASRRPSAS